MPDPFRIAAAPVPGARRSAPDAGAGASPPPGSGPVGLVHLALWLGLVSGFAQVVWHLVTLAGGHLTSFYAHPYARLGAHLLWMPVLAQVAMLVPPAAGVAVCARRWPRLAGRAWWVALLLVPAYLGVLLLIASLHPYAALLLACGLAARTAPRLASS